MDKIGEVFGLSKPNSNPTATSSSSTTITEAIEDSASKRKSKFALDLAQAQCNPMSMIGMGYATPPRSSVRQQSQTTSSDIVSTISQAPENSISSPTTIPASNTRIRRNAISSGSSDQARHSRLHAAGRHTFVSLHYSSLIPDLIPETPDEPLGVPHTPPNNSHTEAVRSLSPGGKKKEGCRSKVLDIVAEIDKKEKN